MNRISEHVTHALRCIITNNMARKIVLSLNNCLNFNLATLFWTPPRAQAQSLRPARGAARFRTRCAPKAGLWPWGQARCCPLSDRRTPKAGLVASGGAVAPFLDPAARSKLASGAGPHRRPRGCNFGPDTPPLAGLCALCGWLGQKVTT